MDDTETSRNLSPLRMALGFGPRPDASTTAGASGSAASGTAGASGQSAAAGLGVDEYVDPNAAGRDGARHVAMKHLPGNALNMVEMIQLREHNHLSIRETARRTGNRRSVTLDTVGLELLQKLQRDAERSHFSQASAASRKAMPSEIHLAGGPVEGPESHPDTESVVIRRSDEGLPNEAIAADAYDPVQTLTGAARARATRQREELLELCMDAHVQAASDLAALNKAEGHADTLRDQQSERRGSVTPDQEKIDELRADRAEGAEAEFRQQFSVSNARAVRLANSVQGRRIGLNRMLRGRAPR